MAASCRAVRPAAEDAAAIPAEPRLAFSLDGAEEVQLTNGPGGDGLPHLSPIDGRLAFVSDRDCEEDVAIPQGDRRRAATVGDVVGTIEDMRWAPEARA